MTDENEALALAEELEEAFEEAPKKKQATEKQMLYFGKKIQDDWIPDIMAWASDGLSLNKIAKEVEKKFGIKVTGGAVRLVINKVKADRAQVSKAVVQTTIGQYIVGDLEILKKKKQELVELSDQFKEAKDWKNYYSAVDRIKEYSKMLFELSGVHEQQTRDEAENAKQDLLDMFNRFEHGPIGERDEK